MSALDPVLVAREKPTHEAMGRPYPSSWTAELGNRWGATALLAAAAVAALLAVRIGGRGAESPSPGPDDVALALIASDGDLTVESLAEHIDLSAEEAVRGGRWPTPADRTTRPPVSPLNSSRPRKSTNSRSPIQAPRARVYQLA